MLELLDVVGLKRSDESTWAYLRKRGSFLRRPRGRRKVEVVASGRADWIG